MQLLVADMSSNVASSSATPVSETMTSKCQRVYLMRHGERLDYVDPNWRLNNEQYYDPPLSDEGLDMSKQITAKLNLKSLNIQHIISSPFYRTIQTAYSIARDLSIDEITISYGMSELISENSGIVSKPSIDINQQIIHFKDLKFLTHGEGNLPTFPESFNHSTERYANTIYTLANLYWPKNLLIVTHAFALRSACEIFSSLPIEGDIPFCGVMIGKRYSIDDKWAFDGTLHGLKVFKFSKI